MEYCCHVWTGAPSCFLKLLEKLQKQIFKAVGPSLAVSWALGSLSKSSRLNSFYRYYFGRCLSEQAQLVPLPYSRGRFTHYSDKLLDFSVTIPRYYEDVYVNSFFLGTARLWNSLPIKCLPLTNVLNGFNPSNNLLALSLETYFLLNRFPVCFILFVLLLLLVIPWLAVAIQPCMEWIPICYGS